jgi:hypothetical protein
MNRYTELKTKLIESGLTKAEQDEFDKLSIEILTKSSEPEIVKDARNRLRNR